MKFIFTPTAEEQFDSLTSLNRRRIGAKTRFYATQPDPLVFAEPLTGSAEYRFRIGDYRVIYKINDVEKTVTVIEIGHRSDVY